MKAYLDIETDKRGVLNVVGIYLENEGFIQLYGKDITTENVENVIVKAETIVTFNGDSFDLPFIKKFLHLDLKETHSSLDLFKVKKKMGIKGGLKELERRFGIERKTEGVDGYRATLLWERYIRNGELDALNLLLAYNREDVMNLVPLEKILLGKRKSEVTH